MTFRPPDWLPGALAAQDAYRGDFPDDERPAPMAPMGSLARSPLETGEPRSFGSYLDELPANERDRLRPPPTFGMTGRFVDPANPLTAALRPTTDRFRDFYSTIGGLAQGDPRFVVRPEVEGQWSDRDEARAALTAGELTRRAMVTGLDATTGGIPFAKSGTIGSAGGRMVIPQPARLQSGETSAAMGRLAEQATPGSQAWREMPNPDAKFPQYADVYPPVGPPSMELKDKPKFPGETYPAKQLTPEAEAFKKERAKIMKDMEKNGYPPYFPPEERFDVDPAHYPLNVDTTTVLPKRPDILQKHLDKIGAEETRKALQDAYAKGVELGGPGPRLTTQDWYMMGQFEQDLVRQLGPEAGRAAFRERFATSMAATTGGMDPRSNLIASGYQNYLAGRGERWPEAHQWPFPVGARYGEQLANTAQRITDEGGFQALGAANPKRHNFAGNFMGHTTPGTMDEQMTTLMQKKGSPDWYGVNERISAEEAAKAGVDPRKFQETVWHGYKDETGKPMISEMNDAIERTHRLTGRPREDIVRLWGLGKIPIYAIPGMMGGLAAQDAYSRREQ